MDDDEGDLTAFGHYLNKMISKWNIQIESNE